MDTNKTYVILTQNGTIIKKLFKILYNADLKIFYKTNVPDNKTNNYKERYD